MDPDDRDSPQYRAEFRNAVYECLYAVAEENLSGISVVLVGPFTREIHEEVGNVTCNFDSRWKWWCHKCYL